MENTPQLDGNGEYVDTKGRIWTTFMGMGPKLGIDPTTISNNMSPAAAVLDGLNTVGSPAPLHLKEEIRRAVRHLLNIPKKRDVTGTGIYTTKSGKQYATAPAAARHFGLQAASTIHNIAARTKVEILQGRDEQGVVILFSLDDLARDPTIQARLNGQIRVDKNGYYTDNEGIVWATVNAFYDNLPKEIKEKTDKSAVWNQAKKYCQSKSAIDRGGRPNAEIFRIDELETKALALAKEDFRVDKNTGYYSEKDEQGNEIMRWATKNVWLDLLKVTRFALKKGLEKTFRNWDKVLRRRGLSQNGKPDWLYSEKIIKEILAYIFEAKIQFENGTYVQEI
ncbi:hypothetical protein HZA40_04780, partial [Candidatus Peregrinibacteria bacterium]|nr:hypothetical protein [Candidatus Peregrinibacteria bacterium]